MTSCDTLFTPFQSHT